jgi:hypothetical protein
MASECDDDGIMTPHDEAKQSKARQGKARQGKGWLTDV